MKWLTSIVATVVLTLASGQAIHADFPEDDGWATFYQQQADWHQDWSQWYQDQAAWHGWQENHDDAAWYDQAASHQAELAGYYRQGADRDENLQEDPSGHVQVPLTDDGDD